jgi:hypothetical protein
MSEKKHKHVLKKIMYAPFRCLQKRTFLSNTAHERLFKQLFWRIVQIIDMSGIGIHEQCRRVALGIFTGLNGAVFTVRIIVGRNHNPGHSNSIVVAYHIVDVYVYIHVDTQKR